MFSSRFSVAKSGGISTGLCRLTPENMTRLFSKVGVDTIVFDVQDVGARFYTFVWTMWDALVGAAGAATVTKFVVLDRPVLSDNSVTPFVPRICSRTLVNRLFAPPFEGADEATHQRPPGAAACGSLFLLTCALLVMTSSHPRPNPVGGVVIEGPVLEMAFASFIGRLPIALRHGMTVGELATLFYHVHLDTHAQESVSLEVVQMAGWQRGMHFGDTGLPFVMPSPNMPTVDTALVYPGCGIFEGTTLSEGRGTTRPFEIVGAAFLDYHFAADLRLSNQKHARPSTETHTYRATYFTPTFSKFVGNLSSGVEIYVNNPKAFTSVDTALEILLAAKAHSNRGAGAGAWAGAGGGVGGRTDSGRQSGMRVDVDAAVAAAAGGGAGFAWVDGTGANFDLHLGNNSTRLAIEAGKSVDEIVAAWATKLAGWNTIRTKHLLY